MGRNNINKVKVGDVIKIRYMFDYGTFRVEEIEDFDVVLKHVWFFGLLPGIYGTFLISWNSHYFKYFDEMNPRYSIPPKDMSVTELYKCNKNLKSFINVLYKISDEKSKKFILNNIDEDKII